MSAVNLAPPEVSFLEFSMVETMQVYRGPVRIGSTEELDREQIDAILALLSRSVDTAQVGAHVLGGRGNVLAGEVPGIGRVVVKPYSRGGLLRKLVARRYVRWGKTRSELEFRLLKRVRELGVQAPEPIAFVSEGEIFYRAWLVTREIPHHRNLVEVSLEDEELTRRCIDELARQLSILIENRIFHIDLHPGNVLIDEAEGVYIVDFDKACRYSGRRNTLRDHYLRRWRRAVIKHELPEMLSEVMCLRLRKHYE